MSNHPRPEPDPRGPGPGEGHREPPGYDSKKQGYTGISAGAGGGPEAVRSARDFAEMIVDTIREGLLVLDFDLYVQAANESFYQMFGVRPEETVGRRVYDLGNRQWDLPELRELLEGILPHDKAFDGYEVQADFDGLGRRFMVLNARRLDDHQLILLAIEDTTERRLTERELVASEERFRLLAENAKEYAVLAMDPANRITLWSPAAERLLGWSEAEALGQSGALIFTEEDRAAGAPEQEVAEALAEGSALDERWHVRKDGSRFWASGSLVALRDEGAVRGFVKILRDNTARKQAEEALHQANETLAGQVQEQTRHIRELSRALALAEQEERRRIAQVLHDDLQQVLFAVQIALAAGDTGRGQALLDEAMTTTRSLAHGLSPPLLEGEDVEQLLGWVAERARERYGLDLAVEVRGDVPMPEPALRVLLYQMVRELLFNVAKHAGTERARVVVERADGCVHLVVADEGAGFDVAVASAPGAGGLGLRSVRERVELLGGQLAVESAPGRGTRVTITVPVGDAAALGD